MATVTVRGSGAVGASPDEATVTIELAELRATSEEAYNEVAERSQAEGWKPGTPRSHGSRPE